MDKNHQDILIDACLFLNELLHGLEEAGLSTPDDMREWQKRYEKFQVESIRGQFKKARDKMERENNATD